MKNVIRIGAFVLASGALGILLATAAPPLYAADNSSSVANSVQTIKIYAKRYQFEPSIVTRKQRETPKLAFESQREQLFAALNASRGKPERLRLSSL